MARVELLNLCKTYDDNTREAKSKPPQWVIDDLSLHIAQGEFVVLVGPSGCGKSTVLRMIAGLETPTSGSITIGEHVVNNIAPKDRDIAMVFQNYALYPHMSVYDNMAFGLKMRHVPKAQIQARVSQAAQILGLREVLNRKPKQLSGGQRQRVALGRAIVRNPQVFLMDEPLSNLDAKLRVHMRTEITRLHRQLNGTTLYVTHDQTEAMTMGDRIVVLNQGKIEQAGPPMQIYNQPATMFVASFMGQMNFIEDPVQKRVLGLRPEHLHGVPERSKSLEANSSAVASGCFTLLPEQIEPLGSEQWVHGTLSNSDIPSTKIVVKLPPDIPVALGCPLALQADLAKASWFDAQTQKRISN